MSSPQQIPSVLPYLTIAGAAKAIDFYKSAFGAEVYDRQDIPGGDKVVHATLGINGGVVMLSDDMADMSGAPASDPKALGGASVTVAMFFGEAAIDAAWNSATGAGCSVVMPLEDQFWGSKYGILEDPFGHHWSFSTPPAEVDPEEMAKRTAEAFSAQG